MKLILAAFFLALAGAAFAAGSIALIVRISDPLATAALVLAGIATALSAAAAIVLIVLRNSGKSR